LEEKFVGTFFSDVNVERWVLTEALHHFGITDGPNYSVELDEAPSN